MISVRVEDRKFEAAFARLMKSQYPDTVAHALNATAQALMNEARENVKRRLTVRTAFTLNSIRQDRVARGQNLGKMHARVGSTSKYLHLHDEGETVTAKKSRIPIPTLKARGGSKANIIQNKYSMRKIQLGKNFFMGSPRGESGIPGIWERKGGSISRIRSLTRSSVKVPATRWYSDAERKYGTHQFLAAQFRREANKRLKAKFSR